MLAVCSPYQQDVGNSVILDVLLEQQVDTIDVRDGKGTYVLVCLVLLIVVAIVQ